MQKSLRQDGERSFILSYLLFVEMVCFLFGRSCRLVFFLVFSFFFSFMGGVLNWTYSIDSANFLLIRVRFSFTEGDAGTQ